MLCTPLERYDPSYFRNDNPTMNVLYQTYPPYCGHLLSSSCAQDIYGISLFSRSDGKY